MKLSVWLASMGVFAAAVALALFLHSPREVHDTSPREDALQSPKAQPLYRTPILASAADRELMLTWYRLNESCRGGIGESPGRGPCQDRDRETALIKARGWCWPYPDRLTIESEWHRCALEEPGASLDPVERDQAYLTGVAAGFSQENQQAVEAVQLSPSPALRSFEKIILSRNIDLSTAEAVESCGIRTGAWLNKIRGRIAADLKADPSISAGRETLSSDEHAVATAFITASMSAHKRFILGNDRKAGCNSIAEASFLMGFDNYAAGRNDNLPSGSEGHSSMPS